MATLKAYSLSLALSLFIVGSVMAGNDNEFKVEKTKSYSKSYTVSSSDRINFDNRFGELKITTWDKNEVKVDITMTGKANTDEVAQEVLDRISISDSKSGSNVYFKTKIADRDWPKGSKYNNTGFSIDYVVYMPARNPLVAENEFGKTIIPDYQGEITISQKFGKLTAGKLSNVKDIHIEFSGGSLIESMNGGKVDIHFSRSEIRELKGKIKATFEHCGEVKLGVTSETTDLNIKNSFTTLILDAAKNLSASYDIYTNFSELDNRTSFSIKEEGEDDDRHGPKFDHDYSGKSGSGGTPVKVKSEFGKVIIGHNIDFDVNKESKDKDKSNKKVKTV